MDAFPIWLAQIWLDIEAFLAIDYERLTDADIIIRLVIQAFLFILSAFYSGSGASVIRRLTTCTPCSTSPVD